MRHKHRKSNAAKLSDHVLKYLIPWAGLDVAGDLGGYTFYTNKNGRRIYYVKAPPTKPPTAAQLRCRKRFGYATLTFKQLPESTQLQWEKLAQKLGLIATGLNLWISLSLTQDSSTWNTIVHKTQTTLTPPSYLPP